MIAAVLRAARANSEAAAATLPLRRVDSRRAVTRMAATAAGTVKAWRGARASLQGAHARRHPIHAGLCSHAHRTDVMDAATGTAMLTARALLLRARVSRVPTLPDIAPSS